MVTLANAEGERTAAAAVDRELMRSALTLAMKVARVSGYFEPRSAEAWAADAVPNLLLVERLITSVREGLTGLWRGWRPHHSALWTAPCYAPRSDCCTGQG